MKAVGPLLFLVCLIEGFSLSAAAAQQNSTVEFVKEVRPILSKHCAKCHGPDEAEAGLALTDFASASQDGNFFYVHFTHAFERGQLG